MTRVLVSAEPGCTHGGRLEDLLALVRMAADCGADAYKSQWVSSPERLCERRRAPEYLDAYRMIAFPPAWHEALRKACDDAGLLYGCSCYLPEDVPVVAPFVDFHKVASFEAGDRKFLEAHLALEADIWISLGMMEWGQVEGLISWWNERRNVEEPFNDDVFLHCVSAYPCPLLEASLSAIRSLRECWFPIGFSDHTGSAFTGALAVAAGAQALEVHVRLDDADPLNPDYPHALPPWKFREYIDNVRMAESAMGDGSKRIMPAEQAMLRYRVK